jgi:hypothetical protein
MAESMQSLARRGLISPRQLKRRFQTGKDGSGVPTKMAAFEDRTKDEGSVHQTGEVPANEINHPTNQRKKKVGTVSKGGGVGREGQVDGSEIEAAEQQKPNFPKHGTKLEAGETRRRVGVAQSNTGSNRSSGGQYGGPSSRKYG